MKLKKNPSGITAAKWPHDRGFLYCDATGQLYVLNSTGRHKIQAPSLIKIKR